MPTYLSAAKVNLYLKVGPKGADGFHSIRTLMAKLKLSDKLIIAPSSSFQVADVCCRVDKNFEFCLKFAKSYPKNCRRDLLKNPKENLVVKAYEILKRMGFKLKKPIRLTLIKKIPSGAGLGGGSSNAAASLRALAQEMTPKLKPDQLLKLGQKLGSDVAFFLYPQKWAWAAGRGEKVRPISGAIPRIPVFVIYPGFGVSTKKAYAWLDKDGLNKGRVEGLTKKGLLGRLFMSKSEGGGLYNTFEGAVLKRRPILKRLKEELKCFGAGVAGLSGSGSAVFGLNIGRRPSRWLKQRLSAKRGIKNVVYYETHTDS